MAAQVGTIAALWLFPVKSMQGHRVATAELTPHGLAGDRGHALLDVATGKIASAKNVRAFPGLFACRAEYLGTPRPGEAPPPARIVLPDGRETRTDAPEADAVLSAHFGRELRLVRQAPEDFAIDMFFPDVDGADPAGFRDITLAQRVGAAYWAEQGLPSPVPAGSFLDLFPATVLTTATLDAVARLAPESRIDARRFRMNIVVETNADGFVENAWPGQDLILGGAARLGIEAPDPRCVMVTLAQGALPQDSRILHALVRHNRLSLGADGAYPCAGVYAVVRAAGTLREGDRVVLALPQEQGG